MQTANMAQHIPTKAFKQKAFRTIEDGIHAAFKKSYGLKTSMRYEYLGKQEGLEVYATMRTIPTGIVYGTERGLFEVHAERAERGTMIIKEIYLVA